ncbi:cytochrome b [Candidatus Berkiella cookevillensis]|uniref:Cytochrome b n=1 Tax=Candidatus Berkiella cookevillensis TaxID=437022 RepID=A0A0Q9YHQ9_9GAMM|nr:cytochrome b [Candidatus Berkiella cookevillensis]MCS5708258.1 cytochrome b [Candidatus Berkiella cookevillensis]
MQLMNNEKRFGSLSKLLHWTIFVLYVIQYFLVYRREYFPKDSPEKLQYILLHKSFGVCVLALGLFMLMWRHVGTRPSLPPMPKIQVILAKIMHILLYLSMLVMPISGICMSMLSGRPVSVFGWFELPMLLAKNEALGGIFYKTHVFSSYAVIGLVAGHTLAALYHHFVNKDDVLKKMTCGV